eukprot:7026160-Pyramimonas_sp.AAC.1
MAMGVIRLRHALQKSKFPWWAARVFRVLPPYAQLAISNLDETWLPWCQSCVGKRSLPTESS